MTSSDRRRTAPFRAPGLPGSKRSSVNGLYGEAAVRLSVAAPPVDGKANVEVEKVLPISLASPKAMFAW
jgi:uncharacterized protein YggU (UPF0235/DUF167 family)